MIAKVLEFSQKNNDIYFLENVGNKIIINDNYSGILVLNNKLKVINKISFVEEITIYSSYINTTNEEILLYCPDNSIFVYINVKSYKQKIIKLKDPIINNMIFSNQYIWVDNNVLLSTYKSEFILINIKNSLVEIIDLNKLQQKYPAFFKSLSCQNSNNIFELKVSEERIEIYINRSTEFICPPNDFIFLKAVFNFKDNMLIAMCSKKSDVTNSKIIGYSLI